jgi:hypothetical protein
MSTVGQVSRQRTARILTGSHTLCHCWSMALSIPFLDTSIYPEDIAGMKPAIINWSRRYAGRTPKRE